MRIGTITFILLSVALVQISPGKGIRVLSEGPNSTLVEVVPDSLGVDTITANGASFLNLLFGRTVSEFNTQGRYLKKFIPVMVGVFSKQIQVQVIQTDYQSRSMMPPIRSPHLSSSPAVIRASDFVSYNAPFEQRRHYVSEIRVYPFLYDSLSGSFKILKRIVLQVSSAGTSVTRQAVAADHLLAEILVNYSQIKDAIVSGSRSSSKGAYRTQSVESSSVLAQGPWYSIAISQSGIYKLTYQNLKDAKIPVDSIHLSTVKIFNNGGTVLPENPAASRPGDLIENAIYIYDAKSDGMFDDSRDYILFYGRSPREWSYDPSSKTYHHYLNIYSEVNYYFLTYGGQAGERMVTVQSNNSVPNYSPQDFICGLAADSELNNLQGSGKDWYGKQLQPATDNSPNSNIDLYINKLNGLDSTQNITYRLAVASRTDQDNEFDVYENSTGQELGEIVGGTVDLTSELSDEGPYAVEDYSQDFTGAGYFTNNRDDMSTLKILFNCQGSTSAQGYVDWVEIFYQRKFQAVNDALNFYGPDTDAVVYDSVRGFSSDNVQIFDVTSFDSVRLVQPGTVNNGTVSFGFQASRGVPRQFFVVGENGFLKAGTISQVYSGTDNVDLKGQIAQAGGADLIIVSAPDFLSQANELGSFKQTKDGLKTIVVRTTDIYNQFGCGIPDPTAIRDYLNYAYSNPQQTPSYDVPSYVILFGSGSYDYKNRVSSVPEYVPAYESDNSLDQIFSYSSDDYFVEFEGLLNAKPLPMSLGRLPARSVQDATTMVSKIKEYEQNPTYGNWRNLITFVADDHDSNKLEDVVTGFTTDSEDLAKNGQVTPPDIDQRKIYLGNYPTIVSTEGIRKPAAAADVVDQINQGTLMMNFVGHGAPNVWSYTNIFNNDVTIPQLTNMNTLTLFVTATCDFGKDDDPKTQSGAELLVLSSQGGAIGVLSSTRPTFEGDNSQLNTSFFQYLLADSTRNTMRIGDAFLLLMYDFYSNFNDIKYNYIGDPTVRLALPEYHAAVDSLNGKALALQTQQIRALSKVEIKGTVYRPDMTVWSDFNGTALLTIFDSDKSIFIPELKYAYVSQGSILFRGDISVKNGLFDAAARIPQDISYSNGPGKIELYFQASGSDGSGYTRNVLVGGTDTSAHNNGIGPEVTIFFDSTNFRDGDIVSQNPTLIAKLISGNGINLSDAAVGHTLQATFYSPDGQQSVDLAPYYTSDVGSYQSGTVKYPVTISLSQGKHSVTVDAFDVFNNPGEATATFDVESSQQLSLTDVYNYPDPFRTNTAFTFERTAVGGTGDAVDVKIKVFTLSGRLVKTIAAPYQTGTFIKIEWNGLDEDGNRLANGVYLYKVIVSTVDGSQTSEAIGKMAVLR